MTQTVLVGGGAELSECKRYRYRLWRELGGTSTCVFVMLNPSTADASQDDPTIRRCKRFAADWGYGRVEVVNLFGWRATRPVELGSVEDPVGPLNDDTLIEAFARSDRLVCAWGAAHPRVRKLVKLRAVEVIEMVWGLPNLPDPMALAFTKSGWPRHPLYVSKSAVPESFLLHALAMD